MDRIETLKRFQQSENTALLIAFLSKVDEFRVITYQELSQAAHREVQKKNRGVLNSARRHCWRKLNKYFMVVTDIGIKLATDEEISSIGGTTIRHVHSVTRVARQKMTLTNLDNLTNRQRMEHMAADAILGLHEQSSRAIVAKRIEADIERTGVKLLDAESLIKAGNVRIVD